MGIVEARIEMLRPLMERNKEYTRPELTEMFWLAHPIYCAKLLIKSTTHDRTSLDSLQGILRFDEFKTRHNTYKRTS